MEEKEIWKPIPGFSTDYEISNLGRARSLRTSTPKLLKLGKCREYTLVPVTRLDGTRTTKTMQRAVYEAFHGPVPEGMEVDHIDNNPENNRPENLRLLSRQENMAKSWELRRATGNTQPHKCDTECKRGHPYVAGSYFVNGKGYRVCSVCQKLRNEMRKRGISPREAQKQAKALSA